MKKYFSNYYAIAILILFIIYNLVFENLRIGGPLYQIFMYVITIVNGFILVIFRKDIKYKSLIILVYFCISIGSKSTLQFIFGISSMIVLMITGFMKSNFIKVITVFITFFMVFLSMPLLFVYLLIFGNGFDEEVNRKDIYENMHYYCDNNYEIYSYSLGAMDGWHYSIGKYYDILDIDGILYISYNDRNAVSEEAYENYLKNNKCILAGDKNGSN